MRIYEIIQQKSTSKVAKSVNKQGVAEGRLNEYAPPSGDGDDGFSEETLKMLAAQWWNGNEDPQVEQILEAAGWEIGHDEGYDNGGVFVVMSGDEHGRSYLSWPAEELESLREGWSKKYKRSIDCNNPKGFSQRAHCQGRKKK